MVLSNEPTTVKTSVPLSSDSLQNGKTLTTKKLINSNTNAQLDESPNFGNQKVNKNNQQNLLSSIQSEQSPFMKKVECYNQPPQQIQHSPLWLNNQKN
jgi:predicted Rossmann fold nucleotide-binding protein DprA/Smf involved in DNA uptake